MNKNCLIYETLNGVKDLEIKKSDGMMTLSGVFGVCGIKNNNHRVYETSNYSKMVTEMKERIKAEGGIPGELEHPQMMNITLENISHKITDINIDENGVVTGSITLLNTPKGKIAQAIVEGGLPLFISSRATGNVDSKTGAVTLERISTYDLVGTPGFSQAKLHLNENQVAESINESMYYIMETNNNNDNMNENYEEILKRLTVLEQKIEDLEDENSDLREQLDNQSNQLDVKQLAESIQNWIIEEYSPEIQNWMVNEFAPEIQNWIMEEYAPEQQDNIIEAVNDDFINNTAPKIQEWVVNEYSPVVENWCKTEFASGIQDWIINEYSPEVESWLNESYSESIQNKINESIDESKKTSLNSIDETLKILESIEVSKPKYQSKSIITENLNEPKFIQEMPAELRPKWDLASNEVKESIYRRAKLYNFLTEGAIERFWGSINFDTIKPSKNIYEGIQTIEDERERQIRSQIRAWRSKRGF